MVPRWAVVRQVDEFGSFNGQGLWRAFVAQLVDKEGDERTGGLHPALPYSSNLKTATGDGLVAPPLT